MLSNKKNQTYFIYINKNYILYQVYLILFNTNNSILFLILYSKPIRYDILLTLFFCSENNFAWSLNSGFKITFFLQIYYLTKLFLKYTISIF